MKYIICDKVVIIVTNQVISQEILDRVKLVRFPPIVVFTFVFLYGLCAAVIIKQKEEWTYVESLYFTFISILTVGENFVTSSHEIHCESYYSHPISEKIARTITHNLSLK